MEQRTKKVNIRKAGGASSANTFRYTTDLPARWMRELGVDKDNPEITLSFVDGKIIIEKAKKMEE